MTEKDPYHHGDLRNTLIHHALALLEQKGADHFSLRDVAKTAGVSHNAPYRHFQNKTELLAALAEKGFLNLDASVKKAIRNSGSSATNQLISAGVAYIHQAINRPEIFRLMFGGLLNFDDCPAALKQSADQAYQGLSHIIHKGIDDNSFRAIDPHILTTSAWSAMHGLAMLFIAGHFCCCGKQEFDELVDQVATTIVYGIKI